MRVSCTFVSLAVMLAQQASAAPVIGLPALPLLDGKGRLVDGLSNTLGPVPIAGPLVSDLLESKSRGGLLSTLDVTGKYGIINDHGFVSDFGRSIFDRRDLSPTVKRGEIPIAGAILDKLPGFSQLESMFPIDLSAINDVIEAVPGVSAIESLEQAIPIPNLSKRDAGVQALVNSILDKVPGGKQIEAMIPFEAIPSMRQIQAVIPQVEDVIPQVEAMLPQVEAMIPQALAMVPQAEAFVKSISIPKLGKRDGEVQAFVNSILDKVPGGKQIEAMIPFEAIPSISQIQAAIPQVESVIPQVEAMLPQVEAMVPQVLALVPQAEAFAKSISIPKFSKRDGEVQALVNSILDKVPGGKQLEAMIPFEAIPSISQIQAAIPQVEAAVIPQVKAMLPQIEAMIPTALAMAPQAEDFAKSISTPKMTKRDGEVQALVNSILDQVPGGKQIESIIPFQSIPSMSQLQAAIPQVEALIPQAEAMIPKVLAMVPQAQAMVPQVLAMVPQAEAMIPQVLAMVPQAEAFVKSIALPK